MIVASVSLSTAMLLILNVVKDDQECRLFLLKIGKFELIPFQCLWGAICTFGFVVATILYFKLVNYDNWFAYTFSITYFPAIILVPLTVSSYMKALFSLRPVTFKIKVLQCDPSEAKALLDTYISEQYEGNADLLPATGNEYSEYISHVKGKTQAEHMGRMALKHLKEAFEQKFGKDSELYE